LHHRNIVRLVEVSEGQQVNPKKGSKTVKFIVLELVGGGELFDFVALGGRLTEDQARYYFLQLLDGLNFMHKQGYTHRDLKPENLILDKEFTLKITDMGFAAPIRGRDGSGLLHTQLGTASYMAPEIHLGKPYEGAKVDLFASAIILFVILTQRPPFSSANPQDPHYRLIAAKRSDIFWQAHAEAEDGNDIYTPEFKDLFEKMMSLNPTQRPTIEEILVHPWMQGSVPSTEAIKVDFSRRKAAVDAEAHNERDAKRSKRTDA
jgi:5'-AMP-activated protein kinase catalytic alpha subunit